MKPFELLSQVTYQSEIRGYFEWHMKQGVALMFMIASSDGHTLAHLTGFDATDASLMVVCTGVRDVATGGSIPYALIGTTPKGGNFLASGKMQACAGTADCFKLSFPRWIDISQSRDCHRCPVPAAHFLNFSSTDPHLNDIVCRVQNVSLGGLAVEWEQCESFTVPMLGAITEVAILIAGDSRIPLGKLRVTHITKRKRHIVLGLMFECAVPRQFSSLVLDAQRSQYLA